MEGNARHLNVAALRPGSYIVIIFRHLLCLCLQLFFKVSVAWNIKSQICNVYDNPLVLGIGSSVSLWEFWILWEGPAWRRQGSCFLSCFFPNGIYFTFWFWLSRDIFVRPPTKFWHKGTQRIKYHYNFYLKFVWISGLLTVQKLAKLSSSVATGVIATAKRNNSRFL